MEPVSILNSVIYIYIYIFFSRSIDGKTKRYWNKIQDREREITALKVAHHKVSSFHEDELNRISKWMEFRSRGENESIRIKRNAKIPGFANTEISWIDFREKKLSLKLKI